MDQISETRRKNLNAIAYKYPSQADLAEVIGVSPAYLNHLLTGFRNIGEKTAAKIESALGLPRHTLDVLEFIGVNETSLPKPESAIPVLTLGQISRVPVVGSAQLGDNGHWTELEYPVGHGDGYLNYPTRDKNAYALRCRGESMRPRIRHGEFVIVEPNSEVSPGDEVLLQLKDGRVMVKTFMYRKDGRIHVMSINEAFPPQSFETAEIDKLHLVAAIAKKALWDEGI